MWSPDIEWWWRGLFCFVFLRVVPGRKRLAKAIGMFFWMCCFPHSLGTWLYSPPRSLACTPTLTSFSVCLATRSLQLGTCTLISSLNTVKHCCPVGRLQPKSFYARQLWVSSSKRKLCLMFSKFRHKVWNAFLFPLLVKILWIVVECAFLSGCHSYLPFLLSVIDTILC